jgi:hypothetical protein
MPKQTKNADATGNLGFEAKHWAAADALRVIVKRILRKHGYPPDKQEKATQLVLEQAEVLSAEWAA